MKSEVKQTLKIAARRANRQTDLSLIIRSDGRAEKSEIKLKRYKNVPSVYKYIFILIIPVAVKYALPIQYTGTHAQRIWPKPSLYSGILNKLHRKMTSFSKSFLFEYITPRNAVVYLPLAECS